MSVATPKHQAKHPINFDVIIVCRKHPDDSLISRTMPTFEKAFAIADSQVFRLKADGWKLSRNEIGVIVMGQVICDISKLARDLATEEAFDQIETHIGNAIDRLVTKWQPEQGIGQTIHD